MTVLTRRSKGRLVQTDGGRIVGVHYWPDLVVVKGRGWNDAGKVGVLVSIGKGRTLVKSIQGPWGKVIRRCV